MKKFVVSVLALISAGSAMAADLPNSKAPTLTPPPPPPPPIWTGFYVGLNAGGTWSNSSNQISSWSSAIGPGNPGPNPSGNADYAAAAILGLVGNHSANSGGFIGGGQFGYNYQIGGAFVAGIEADIQGIAGSGGGGNYWRNVSVLGPNLFNHNYLSGASVSRSVDYLGTVRGRIGYLVTPTLLIYGTGGLAYGGVNLRFNGAQLGYNHNPDYDTTGPGYNSFSQTQAGWTAGGGVEWMFMPNWSAKAEYLYYDLGSARTNVGYTYAAKTRGAGQQFVFLNSSQVSSRFNGNIVRAGVNYHFNFGSAPVVAKF
jgi:outer membrane immunogenic protein